MCLGCVYWIILTVRRLIKLAASGALLSGSLSPWPLFRSKSVFLKVGGKEGKGARSKCEALTNRSKGQQWAKYVPHEPEGNCRIVLLVFSLWLMIQLRQRQWN
jgi:hypothetical protein